MPFLLLCCLMLFTNLTLVQLAQADNSSALAEPVQAPETSVAADYDVCLLETLKSAERTMLAEEIKTQCSTEAKLDELPLTSRFYMEEKNTGNQFAITPHKPNYFLPYSYNNRPNEKPFQFQNNPENLDNEEFLFQLSMKVALWEKVLGHRTNLFFAYTGRFWWQAYNDNVSAPFRETNHEPEVFLDFEPHWSLGSWTANSFSIGLVHQSNGRSQPLSRSWNRIYLSAEVEKNNWVIAFRPWYHLPEEKKQSPDDPSGDDNPDIDFYMGHFELMLGKRFGGQHLNATLRNNLRSDNRGAVQLDWTFPLWETTKLRGYVQYFNGYGESLIDYNERSNRLSIGFTMTEWF